LDTILVKEGSLLLAGQQLGTAGKKGTKQPHLHFQIIDESMPSGIQTSSGSAVLAGNINPLYLMDPTLNYSIADNKGCRAQGGPEKFFEDYLVMDNPHRVRRLSTGNLFSIRQLYGSYINAAALQTRLHPEDIGAMLKVESGGNRHVTSPTGASGPMQFMPSTAHQYGLCDQVGKWKFCVNRDDRNDPEKAILAGAQFLRDLFDHYSKYTTAQTEFAAAAYNAGEALIDD
ncbi:MAG: M23 family metallopeptidase, partial [Candidatus Woesearchaeota archaeon]